MTSPQKLIIVTDLDATLLDEKYSYQAALPAIAKLKALGFPIVLNSSKTFAELKSLCSELELNAPVVAENGGVIAFPNELIPGEYISEIKGLDRAEIIEHAHALREKYDYQFAGFSDWTLEEVAQHTDLSMDAAELAAQRQVTEPMLWHDTAERWDDFVRSMESFGARCLQGGRFFHLMGQSDKAEGLRSVVEFYREKFSDCDCISVALGDSANDQQMLNAADIAVIIPHAAGPRISSVDAPHVIHADFTGPEGWNAAILQILTSMPSIAHT
ncbi:MAG: HAD-IIB family hydrolase [Akkermansiaceae bacterium]